MENKNPKLRFKGFDEEWENTSISDNVTFSKGKGYSKSDILPKGEPLLLYGSLYTNYKTNIDSINTYTLKKEDSVISIGNEVVVPASGETAEDIARASAIKRDGIILGGDLNIVTPNEAIDSTFLALEITHGKSHAQLVKKAQGISVVHLHNSDLQDLTIDVPEVQEQQKIGDFFKELDDLIMAKEQEVEKLKQIKAALLENMFPNEDMNNQNLRGGGKHLIINMLQDYNLIYCENNRFTPRLRFRGYNSNWELKQLSDICTTYSGGTPLTSEKEYYNGKISFIRSGEIHNSTTELTISDKGLNNSSAKMVSKGDILLAIYGATSGEIDISKIDGAINQAILCIVTSEDKYFFMYSWQRNVDRIIASYIQGAQGNLSAELVKDCYMMFPTDITEQRMIGDFFREQDETITNAQHQIVKLRNIKQACLQQMYA